jgi:uncharacterized membrane protein
MSVDVAMDVDSNGLTAELEAHGSGSSESPAAQRYDLCPESWRRFADQLLLGVGVASLLAAVMMLVAYNWSSLDRFVKLGLLQGTLVVTVAIAWRARWQTFGGRLALCATAILLGPLLALLGQIYQGAASDYRLFLLWALLILPWGFVARWAPIWLLVAILLDIAAWRFWQTRYVALWSAPGGLSHDYFIVAAGSTMALVNATGWLLARSRPKRADLHDERPAWLEQTLALGTIGCATFAELVSLLLAPLSVSAAIIVPSIALGLAMARRQQQRQQALITAGLLLCCIVLVSMLVQQSLRAADVLPEWLELLVVGLVFAVQGGVAASWLRHEARSHD